MSDKAVSNSATASELARACRTGDLRALAKLISLLESDEPSESTAASDAVAGFDYPSHVIGISGPPGAGKSTLIAYLAELALQSRLTPNPSPGRGEGNRVAILAVDPSSPFTGGALLGDRIRMAALRNEPNVFIRSMGSRGAAGGLTAAASSALRALGAAGFDMVLLETIGAGQAETEIINLAHTVCVIQVPGFGDEVQLMKMGILEAADVFAVNKSDMPDAADVKARLEMAIAEHPGSACRVLKQLGRAFSARFASTPWTPPVVLMSALKHENGPALLEALVGHRAWLDQPELREAMRQHRARREILARAESLMRREAASLMDSDALNALTDSFLAGKISLDDAGKTVLKQVLPK